MKKTQLLVQHLLLGLLIIGLCACEQIASKHGAARSVQQEAKVCSTEQWSDTGIDLEAGQVIIVEAKGEVNINNKTKSTPNGVQDQTVKPIIRLIWKTYNVTPDAKHGALIGKIGETGKPFFVGKSCEFKADSAGRLFLGVNDMDLKNNKGAFQALIAVQ